MDLMEDDDTTDSNNACWYGCYIFVVNSRLWRMASNRLR